MRSLRFFFISILAVLVLFFGAGKIEAHPGRTAADGCHYCRTNCDYWGVPWNERHCHGGILPQPTTQPYVLPTTPRPTPTPTPTPTETPTPEPAVKGETTQTSPSPVAVEGTQTKESGAGGTLMGLAILAVIGGGGFWLVKGIIGRLKSKPPEQ